MGFSITKLLEIGKSNKDNEFEDIYKKHIKYVYKYLYIRTGNKEVSEDLASETFETFYRIMDRYDNQSKIETFIIGIAINKLKNYYHNLKPMDVVIDEELIEQSADSNLDKSREFELKKQTIEVLKALPDNYSQILKLKFIDNCSNKEIAEIMETTEVNVRKLKSRALAMANKLFINSVKDGK